ncbi:hypothetical protein [Novosphingobium sp. JCM 18896]|uniref:hypothetical protein n=1 Tax=Novosphingobium sp. JCM 18896 TaxID=2989731 RepID=UPI0022232895|nr:hypothetical protein [Novosphingobium sp. JCM 18896]MCW1430268.1 hypothetical protein [Novosphingobium sp. JCM 18896]
MPQDYDHGRRDGLRLALAVLAAEEAKWAALVGQSRSRRTNATREVRLKTLQVAQQRIRTALNRLSLRAKGKNTAERSGRHSGPMDPELASALVEIGL